VTTNDQRPLRTAGVAVRDRTGRPALIDHSGTSAALLNETALAIWDLCDGSTTIEEMIIAVVELCGDPPDVVRADVDKVLGELRDLGLVDLRE